MKIGEICFGLGLMLFVIVLATRLSMYSKTEQATCICSKGIPYTWEVEQYLIDAGYDTGEVRGMGAKTIAAWKDWEDKETEHAAELLEKHYYEGDK